MSSVAARPTYPAGFRARRGLNWGGLGVLYASYYMARYNFRFATPGMVEEFGFDVAGITQIFVVWSLAYGTGQLINGLLADRIGGKTSMLIGAAGTIVCNLIFGFSSFVGTLATFGLIAILNGWFQSCGAPGMIKINAAWFARQERGTFSGIFGIMIQLGQYAINTLAPFLLGGFAVTLWFVGTWVVEPGTWRILFIIPPFVTAAAAVLMALTAKEEPAAAGFPKVIHDELDDSAGTRVSLKESFVTIFTHPLVWFYAAAYACTGAVRHSSDQLSVLFFTQQLGIDMKAKPLAVLIILNLMTTTAILGSVLSGWVSDKFFGGHRSPVARFLYLLEAVVISTAALMMFTGLIKPGLLGVTLAGIFLVLVSLTVNSTHSVVGAAAPMDIGGKKMAGFAAGVIDSFQYYGSAICLFITGILIKKFGWASWYPVMILFALGGALAMHHVRKVQLHHKNSPDGDPRIKNS
ncbi:MAG: MFS transporter [Verrucomicrobia bacterium]|jgi:MFS transporter, OPA family, glycerol-3-phosphate transporter|nr:MFS transporter [Verrucomicrobiota bacterium]